VNTDPALSGIVIKELSKSKNIKYNEVESVTKAKSIMLGKEHVDCLIVGIDGIGKKTLNELISLANGNGKTAAGSILLFHSEEIPMEQENLLREIPSIRICKTSEKEISEALVNFRSTLNEPSEKFAGQAKVKMPVTELTGKKVLIVDDDMRNIYSISAILEERKMNIIIAVNGTEALRKLEKDTSIDIVLLDIMMPEMDGYEVLKRIRSIDALKTLPVIALTANALSETQDRCMELEASGYLTKPVNNEQLMNLLETCLNT
jgi:CheY-like chemotaxis protein